MTGIPAAQDLACDAQRVVAGLFILFGLMFSVGGMLLLRWNVAAISTLIASGGYLWLRKLGTVSRITEYLPEPPTHPSPDRP